MVVKIANLVGLTRLGKGQRDKGTEGQRVGTGGTDREARIQKPESSNEIRSPKLETNAGLLVSFPVSTFGFRHSDFDIRISFEDSGFDIRISTATAFALCPSVPLSLCPFPYPVTRYTSSSVVSPAFTFSKPSVRSVFSPDWPASVLNSDRGAPWLIFWESASSQTSSS